MERLHWEWRAVCATEQTTGQFFGTMQVLIPFHRQPMKQPTISQHCVPSGVNTPHLLCPLCAAELIRIPRRPIDRFTSLFGEHHRFRCERFACQWEGNLRADDTAEAAIADSAH